VIFIDTGAILARYVKRDQFHANAVAYWEELADSNTPCYTSNLVVSETLTLLGRRTDHRFAAQRAHHLYSSNVLQILRPDINDEIAAVSLLEKYADQEFSFCDCVSFVLMHRHKIPDAFTFDNHFSIAGFTIRP